MAFRLRIFQDLLRDDRLVSRRSSVVLAALFWGVCLGTLARHEPWRDEAQAWLIARDADMSTLFRLRPHEARPAVWDLMLVPLAKAGLPIFAGQVMHLSIAAAAVFVLSSRGPFPLWLKLAFAFSYYQCWQYAVVMRIYAVAFFWLWCIAAGYADRYARPGRFALLVVLLYNTTIHAGFLATAITFLFFADSTRAQRRDLGFWCAGAMMVAGGFACVCQVWMNTEHPHIVQGTFRRDFDYTQIARGVAAAGCAGWPANWVTFLGGASLLGAAFLGFLSRWRILLAFGLNVAGHLFIYGRIGGHTNHHGWLPFGILFCLWLTHYYEPDPWWRIAAFLERAHPRRCLAMILAASCWCSFPPAVGMHVSDWYKDYSGAHRMAVYLQSLPKPEVPIVSFHSSRALAVLAELPQRRCWSAEIEESYTYLVQDFRLAQGERLTQAEVLDRVSRRFRDEPEVRLLLDSPLDTSHLTGWILEFKVDESVFGSDERLHLYCRRPNTVAPVSRLQP